MFKTIIQEIPFQKYELCLYLSLNYNYIWLTNKNEKCCYENYILIEKCYNVNYILIEKCYNVNYILIETKSSMTFIVILFILERL